MKVAVLGANGMLGARVCEELERAGHEVLAVTRKSHDLRKKQDVWNAANWSDWVVNCAGIVKSRIGEVSIAEAVIINSAMPHWIEETGCNVIHISTDCVFSGDLADRPYDPRTQPDPVDLYGATKLAGELHGENSITLRTSFIGWENGTQRGLLEWLVRQKKVSGYVNALWSGLSAREVARAVVRVIGFREDAHPYDLFQLAGAVISKYELLCVLNRTLNLGNIVDEVEEPRINRSMRGDFFNHMFDYSPPTWEEMAEELARERPT